MLLVDYSRQKSGIKVEHWQIKSPEYSRVHHKFGFSYQDAQKIKVRYFKNRPCGLSVVIQKPVGLVMCINDMNIWRGRCASVLPKSPIT